MPAIKTIGVLISLMIALPAWAEDTNSFLIRAVELGDYETVQTLLAMGADINTRDFSGRTPLMNAASGMNDVLVDVLLDAGADVNLKTPYGYTALLFASWHNDDYIVRKLLKKGADVNAKTKDGKTPLIFAAEKGHNDVIRALFNAGADVNAKDKDNITALKWVEKNYVRMVRILKRESFYPLEIINKTHQAKVKKGCSFSDVDFSGLYVTEYVDVHGKIKNNCTKPVDIHIKANVFGEKKKPVGSRDLWIKSILPNETKEVKIDPAFELGGESVDLTILEIKDRE